MKLLAHDVIGDPAAEKTVIFCHGILGSRNNWRSFAKKLVADRPAWRAVICDLRNHGDSRDFAPPHTIEACVGDVRSLADVVGCTAVVGHSYGGKVALALALERPRGLLDAWILDAPPGTRAFTQTSDVEKVIAAVERVPLPVASRRALVENLRGQGLTEPLCQWMTTNLREVDGGFVWKFNLAAMPAMLTSFGALDLWPALAAHTGAPRIHVVRAGRSDRFSAEDVQRLAQTEVDAQVLPSAGHWLHTDDPAGLLAMMIGSFA